MNDSTQRIELELNQSNNQEQEQQHGEVDDGSPHVTPQHHHRSGSGRNFSFGKRSSHVIMSSGRKAQHYLGSMKSKFESKTGLNTSLNQPDNMRSAANGSSPINCNNNNYNNFAPKDTNEKILVFLSYLFLIVTFPISILYCIKTVYEYQQIVFFRFGKLFDKEKRGAGLYLALPFIDQCYIVDMRTESFNIKAQEILSKDSVAVHVDGVVYFRVCNGVMAITNVKSHRESTSLLAQTTLRTVLGTKTLTEILCDRTNIRQTIENTLDEVTFNWGVKVERVELKDVCLPQSMQRAMAAEAEASREAKAKVIAAEGERQASKAMRLAAEEMSLSPQALQLRYLQTLHTIAAEKNSTIVFPLPVEIFGAFQAMRAMVQSVQDHEQQPINSGEGHQQRASDTIIEMMDNPPTPGSSRGSN